MSQSTSVTTTRLQRTHERTAGGELPAPKNAKLWVGKGTGMSTCNGCEEKIVTDEREYELVFSADIVLWFHAECFSIWTQLSTVNRA